jgi:hypothetical protein
LALNLKTSILITWTYEDTEVTTWVKGSNVKTVRDKSYQIQAKECLGSWENTRSYKEAKGSFPKNKALWVFCF